MTIAILGTPAYKHNNSFVANPVTLAVTVPAGTDCLVLGASVNNNVWTQLTGVTVNGSATGITQQATTPGSIANRSLRFWTLLNPPPGTYNIVWTFNTSSGNAGGFLGLCLSGVDQTTPVSASNASSTGSGSSPLATTITCPAGGLAVGGFYADTVQPTRDASQTLLGVEESNHGFSYKTDATSVVATFTGTPQIAQLVMAMNPRVATTPVSSDIVAAYGISAPVSADLAANYTIQAVGEVFSSLVATYNVLNSVSADLVTAYNIAAPTGSILSDIFINNTLNAPFTTETVFYTLLPNGRTGAITGITPTEGSKALVSGRFAFSGLALGNWKLEAAVRGATAADDAEFVQHFTVS